MGAEDEHRKTLGFALCGILVDLTFVVILSAAHDIVTASALPTSVVLAANILPLWMLKTAAPAFIERFSYLEKICTAALSGLWALVATALLPRVSTKLLFGVTVSAASTGLSEITFFSLVSRYSKQAFVALTVGTGLSAFVGSGFYFVMTELFGFSTSTTLLITSAMPLFQVVIFKALIEPVPVLTGDQNDSIVLLEGDACQYNSFAPEADPGAGAVRPKLTGKLEFIQKRLLFQYMLPLFTIFFTGYLLTQGVVPVITFQSSSVSEPGQYPLYLLVNSIGGLLARASIIFVEMDSIHALSALQIGMLVTLVVHVYWPLIPNLTCMLAFALVQGCLSGVTFVNAFRLINEKIEPGAWREFAMGAVSMADAFGVVLAAGVGILLEPILQSASH